MNAELGANKYNTYFNHTPSQSDLGLLLIILLCRFTRPRYLVMTVAQEHGSKTSSPHVDLTHHAHTIPIEQEADEAVKQVSMSWRSWLVVFCCCFAYGDFVFL